MGVEMAEIKVSEVSPTVLNWLVAKCEGYTHLDIWLTTGAITTNQPNRLVLTHRYATDWGQGGPIIDQNKIGFLPSDGHRGSQCCAFIYSPSQHDLAIEDGMTSICWGTTPLIAAMRCYVTSKLGEEVEVPDELLDD